VRFVTYRIGGEPARPGVIEGDSVRTITTGTLREYIALAPHERIAWHAPDELIPLTSVELDAPVRPPRNVFCVGRNYLEHAKEGARAAGREVKLPSRPTFFTKAATAIAAPGAILHLSGRVSREYDYEAELAVVIGRPTRRVTEAEALDAVLGYTCLNDVSARDLQFGDGQWVRGKSLDTFCPMGPVLVTPDEIGDPQDLEISCRVDGDVVQRASTGQMFFGVAAIISYCSQSFSLEPGDVIATGTPGGVGIFRDPPILLGDGDEVVVEIEGIGRLVNTCRFDRAAAPS
jgi:2-keto-4-pentenoate hydratase/2-oxohepta-3-ene-1,7-dioic acid hydratase in catechol pathway